MKTAPLLLLLASFLLTSHIIRPGACRPQSLAPPGSSLDDGNGHYRSPLDEALLRAAGDSAVSYLLGEKILRFLQTQRNPRMRNNPNAVLLPRFPLDMVDGEEQQVTATTTQLDARALAHLARSLAALETDSGDTAVDAGLNLISKRNGDDAPISIDLTFHLLRNMIEMAKIESMKEQAELNRKFLDEVGK